MDLISLMEETETGGIVVGVDEESSRKALRLVEGSPTLFATAGLHPNSAEQFAGIEPYAELAKNPKIVAIGECGLDNYRPGDVEAAKPRQREVFFEHMHLSASVRKPLMIHARPSKGTQDAYRDLIEFLTSAKREYGDALTGNIHFFVGGIEEARAFIDLDFTLSYTAVLTFTHDYDEAVRYIPLSHIISETDSPYVAPASRRGQRNDPRSIPAVVEAISRIKGASEEEVRVNILRNAERVFKLPSGIL
jgi:TatD DNase family protein